MSRTKIAIVDYEMGNLHSVQRAVQAASPEADVYLAVSAEALKKTDRLILPGQGAMADCMKNLTKSGMRDELLSALQNKPVMGVCVGFQMLFESSEEGNSRALGVLGGQVKRFAGEAFDPGPDHQSLKIPHMGWNQVSHHGGPLWSDIEQGAYFYFVHSYYAEPADPQVVSATCQYGLEFCCATATDNVFAVQFHPEKSAEQGLKLYRNFIEWKI